MQLDDVSTVRSIASMVGTLVHLSGNSLVLSGRPLYLKTELPFAEQLVEQIRHAHWPPAATGQAAVKTSDTE